MRASNWGMCLWWWRKGWPPHLPKKMLNSSLDTIKYWYNRWFECIHTKIMYVIKHKYYGARFEPFLYDGNPHGNIVQVSLPGRPLSRRSPEEMCKIRAILQDTHEVARGAPKRQSLPGAGLQSAAFMLLPISQPSSWLFPTSMKFHLLCSTKRCIDTWRS